MNPFAKVRCQNTDADEHTEMTMRRWQLWQCQWFGNAYSRCWVEIKPPRRSYYEGGATGI